MVDFKTKYSTSKNKFTAFRWQEVDFVFVEKRAKELKISMSEYLRRLVKADREKQLKLQEFDKAV